MFIKFLAVIKLILIVIWCCNCESNGCPTNWKQWSNKCYSLQPSKADYTQGESACRNLGAELLSVHSKEENEFIRSTFTFARLLLSAKKVKGTELWTWPEGRLLTYFNWHSHNMSAGTEPNNYAKNEFCIEIYGSQIDQSRFAPGYWNDRPCGDEIGVKSEIVCQKPLYSYQRNAMIQNLEIQNRRLKATLIKIKESVEKQVNTVINKITENAEKALQSFTETKDVDDHYIVDERRLSSDVASQSLEFTACFNQSNSEIVKCFTVVKDKKSFEDAKKYCEERNSKLVSIENEKENVYIETNTLHKSLYWIGSKRIIPGTQYFANIDGTPFRFFNWASFEPKSNSTANCVNVKHGQWFVNPCDSRMSFICNNIRNGSEMVSRTSLIDEHTADISSLLSKSRQMNADLQKTSDLIRMNTEKNKRIHELLIAMSQLKKLDLNDIKFDD